MSAQHQGHIDVLYTKGADFENQIEGCFDLLLEDGSYRIFSRFSGMYESGEYADEQAARDDALERFGASADHGPDDADPAEHDAEDPAAEDPAP